MTEKRLEQEDCQHREYWHLTANILTDFTIDVMRFLEFDYVSAFVMQFLILAHLNVCFKITSPGLYLTGPSTRYVT